MSAPRPETARPEIPPMWTVKELADHWRVGQSTLRKWIDSGRVRVVDLSAADAKIRCIRITDEERIRFEKEANE